MGKLPRSRIVMVIAAIVGVFVCGVMSLSLINPSRSAGQATNNPSTSLPMPSATMMAMPAATSAPTMAAAYAADGNEGDFYREAESGAQDVDQQQAPLEQGERIVVRSATINITVDETAQRVNEITAIAEGLGGWVVSSSTSVSGGTAENPNVYGNIAIRVPAESFDAAMTGIRQMASIVNNEQIIGQDVTQDYVDTSSRLRNLEAAEAQLQTIMDSAVSVEEVLGVYNQLVSTRGEIEIARGRLQYWDQAAAFSSISVTLNPTSVPVASAPTFGWNPMVTLSRGVEGLVRFAQSAVDAIILLLIYVVPLLLIVALPGTLLWRKWRSKPNTRENMVAATPSDSGE